MSNQNLSDRDIDVLITLGAAEYAKQLEVAAPEDTDISFEASTRFKHKMQKIIDGSKKNHYSKLNRVIAAGIAVVFALGVASSVSVNAFGFRDFIITVYEKYFTVGQSGLNQGSPDVNLPIKSMHTELYLPTWLPDGFEYQDFFESKEYYIIQYKAGSDIIRFTQIGINRAMSVDNEVTDYQEFNELGRTYYILQKELDDKRSVRLVWTLEQYQFVIDSSLDRETLLKIAKNVEYFKK